MLISHFSRYLLKVEIYEDDIWHHTCELLTIPDHLSSPHVLVRFLLLNFLFSVKRVVDHGHFSVLSFLRFTAFDNLILYLQTFLFYYQVETYKEKCINVSKRKSYHYRWAVGFKRFEIYVIEVLYIYVVYNTFYTNN
jgi:hypothetical protein